MATIVVEAFVAVSVESLLKKIASGEFVDFFRSIKLDDSLLKKLNTTLLCLQALLTDAGEQQVKNDDVNHWLLLLQDAVFEAEDLFDEINTEALRCRVKASNAVTSKVRKFLSSRFRQSYGAINSKMQTLFERLDQFVKEGHLLGLKEGVSSSNVWHGTPTSSVVDESSIYGRDVDVKKLKDFLLSQDASDGGSKIGVISIVGMGGLGKTTLAKLLYNDPEVKDKFDLHGWACISKDFDVINITKSLLESINSNDKLNFLHLKSLNSKRNDTSNLNTLQVQLQRSLSNKKFLLVLDDIWDGNYLNWNNLMNIFNAGKMGSKIIITTRIEKVALAMKTFLPIHYLDPLESEDCWSLLAKHAFKASNDQQHSNLEVIGKEIANKCKGLPLAAAALGCLLCIDLSQDYWNGVLNSGIWENTADDVQPALLLSYRCLPTPLKGCFAYCSVFPKKSILEKWEVVQLWIAEGLVLEPRNGKCWEKVGEEYFDELVSRSLIQRRSVDGKECFEMHDLMNDLATTVSSPYCIRWDEEKRDESIERVRHLSYNREEYDSYKKFGKLCGLKGLRTFLPVPLDQVSPVSFVQVKVVSDLLPTMKRLRVLSLSSYWNITELPKTIGNLIYLRYLNLSFTLISWLPSETCKLYNLQTLLLSGCFGVRELPMDMGKLVNLRRLDIRGTGLREMPPQIATLENLQTLSDFIVSEKRDGLKVTELGKFPLRGKLSISNLENVTDSSNAFKANLKAKEKVDDLILKWSNSTSTAPPDPQIQNLVLEQLRPSTNLKNLAIKGYGGNSFPKWLGDSSSFSNMVCLEISGCRNCSLLPPLGQLGNLKELYIENMDSVKSIGGEFFGSGSGSGLSFQPFPSLESLTFVDMPEWEGWNIGFGGSTTTILFPSLRCLSLERCLKLKGDNILRLNLPSLTELELSGCPLLVVESGRLILPPLNSLRKLTIRYFPYLVYFPTEVLPKTLQSLSISCCENLEFLPHESLHNYTSLEDLQIFRSRNSMTSFTLGSLPVLKSLYISYCENLKSIVLIGENGSQSQQKSTLWFLRSISIWNCNELESFSSNMGGGFPTPNLISFVVCYCKKLVSLLPEDSMNALQIMTIEELPNLQSIAIDDGFPNSLRELSIKNVGGNGICWNKSAALWEHRLTCLSELVIGGDDIVKGLMKLAQVWSSLLPASLLSLSISRLEDVKCLDGKWLHHLTSLQRLQIDNSPNLESLPNNGLLPSSLSVLRILWCPLLAPSLLRKRGKEWNKIAHIPFIEIDFRMITS